MPEKAGGSTRGLKAPGGRSAAAKLKKIKALLFDVDGVLTDGRIILGPDGFEAKFFDAKDGHRIRMAKRAGLGVFFITGRNSAAVKLRGEELGIDAVFQSVQDKIAVLGEIRRLSGAREEEMAYMGDDLVDLPVMRRVGFSACPWDAVDDVRRGVDLVTGAVGGRGAAGEFIEVMLKAQGKWQVLIDKYL